MNSINVGRLRVYYTIPKIFEFGNSRRKELTPKLGHIMRLTTPTFENCAFAGIIVPEKLHFCRFALTGQQQLDKIQANLDNYRSFQCPCRNHRHGTPVEKAHDTP